MTRNTGGAQCVHTVDPCNKMPETGYALAKVLCERMAREMHRWNPGTRFVGLRISNIFEGPDYALIPSFWDAPRLRSWNLWSWVDSRDVAQACRLALEADGPGDGCFTVAAADTLMRRPSRELMAEFFPGRGAPRGPWRRGRQLLSHVQFQ